MINLFIVLIMQLIIVITRYHSLSEYSWWRSIVVRPPVMAGELSLSCAKLMASRVTTSWVKRPLSVN